MLSSAIALNAAKPLVTSGPRFWCPMNSAKITSDETLKWRRSSDSAQRGFARTVEAVYFTNMMKKTKSQLQQVPLRRQLVSVLNGIFL